ncbi:hypothetical protein [Klebsiella oxytoca]|uniref:hypothetical protein n=1 Tax=Klebsiella oxytoca TaxID=571 RepID=UPI00157A9DE6|nr:hypothetical protein [Klebsiella oxytoca]
MKDETENSARKPPTVEAFFVYEPVHAISSCRGVSQFAPATTEIFLPRDARRCL